MQVLAREDLAGTLVSLYLIFLSLLSFVEMEIKSLYIFFQVEEGSSNEVELHAIPYVLVLHAFCLVDPTLCAPASNPSQFVVTLQPYLKSQVIH